ncbi:MraY family glycosyltransferase [Tumebacillus sp. DT12]|uniref:MraY family glycosyltransferase n=1 Tax=Tumebacillus lacus TaxID=2995335 RepID=A0ABT3X063_9BACL|nr:MraY family glycosyltransferase [Tumebacillus lacus]MCX7570288.1 MraY family glycosyltransferase [Tumebacillus lacus]
MIELIVGVIAFFTAWLLVPPLRKLAFQYKFVDLPNPRKVHKEPLPLLGGAAIFGGFLLATLLVQERWAEGAQAYTGLVIGAALLFAIGLVDDWFKTRGKDFPAAPRFVIHILAAWAVIAYGGAVQGFTMPFPEPHYVALPQTLSYIVTILWIVGVINVFNFLDGIDGLAGGIAAISAMTLALVALFQGQVPSAIFAIALAGAALGFLRHNFYPARIIMGDAGSTLCGFLLAAISVIGAFKSVTAVSIFVPVLALGVPILDGVRVVIERMLKGQPPHKADRNHSHHKLLDAGFSQRQTVAILYMIGTCFSLTSLIVLLVER